MDDIVTQIEDLQARIMKQKWTRTGETIKITAEDAARIVYILDWARNSLKKANELIL